MSDLIADIRHEFRRHKELADRAIAGLDDESFFRVPAPQVNSIAIIVKHLAGNLRSRWAEFLTSDGEKPMRDRDGEFLLNPADSRASLISAWDAGWLTLFGALGQLGEGDLDRRVTIRGEPHRVQQALVRGVVHAAYHVGQILYVARLLQRDTEWLTIAPGRSRDLRTPYLDH